MRFWKKKNQLKNAPQKRRHFEKKKKQKKKKKKKKNSGARWCVHWVKRDSRKDIGEAGVLTCWRGGSPRGKDTG
jgi:hypothetical protein